MKIVASLFALTLSAAATSGLAAEDGTAAVQAIGRLNGIALACQQPALVSRARNAMLTTAPKTRAYGDAFETATNAAYLEQGKNTAACPDAAALASNLAAAENRLRAAFATPQ